jgi:hypothetical protein
VEPYVKEVHRGECALKAGANPRTANRYGIFPLSETATNADAAIIELLLITRFRTVNTYHVQLFSRLLDKLQKTQDGGGSMLNHTMILYGSGMGDGNVHSHDPISVLLAGGALGQIKGRPPHPASEGDAHREPAAAHAGHRRSPRRKHRRQQRQARGVARHMPRGGVTTGVASPCSAVKSK